MPSSRKQKQRANRRNASKLSGRNPSRVNSSIMRRTIIASADATIASGNSKQVLNIQWSSSIASSPDWSLLVALYQRARLTNVKYMFFMPPFTSSFDVVMVSDIYSNYPTTLNPLQYMQMKGAKPYSSSMRSKNGYTNFNFTAPRGRGTDMADNASTAGQWFETTGLGALLGRTLIVINHSNGTALTSDIIALSGAIEFTLEFTDPFPSSAYEVKLIPVVETDRKSEILHVPRRLPLLRDDMVDAREPPKRHYEDEFVEVKEPPPPKRSSTPRK